MAGIEKFAIGDIVLVGWGEYRGTGRVTRTGVAVASLPVGYCVEMDDGTEHLVLLPALWPFAGAYGKPACHTHFSFIAGRA